MMNNFDQSQPTESDPGSPLPRSPETVDLPAHIELVLCKKGEDWTVKERLEVTRHFFIEREFCSKIVSSLIKRGLTMDDALSLTDKLLGKFKDKKCTFNPDHPKLQSAPDSPESERLTPLGKFEIYLWIQVRYMYKKHLTTGLPPGGIISLEQSLGEGIRVGDTVKSDNLEPWERLDLEHEKTSLIRAEDLKDDEQNRQWKIANQCVKLLPEKQRVAVKLRDLEGIDYESAVEESGQAYNNLRKNLYEGRRKMSEMLGEQGIDYLKLLKDNENAG